MPRSPESQSIQGRLTDAQKAELKRTLGREMEELELRVEDLEERIAPRLASNHNEALLSDR